MARYWRNATHIATEETAAAPIDAREKLLINSNIASIRPKPRRLRSVIVLAERKPHNVIGTTAMPITAPSELTLP